MPTPPWFLYFAVGAILTLLLRRSQAEARLAAIVVKEWLEPGPTEGVLIEVRGRPSGILSFVLNLLHIQPTFHLIVSRAEVEIRSTSWSGQIAIRAPIHRIGLTVSGFVRPLAPVIIGGLCLLALPATMILGDAVRDVFPFVTFAVIGCIAWYLLGRSAMLRVHAGGTSIGLAFSGSALGGRVVGIEAARRLARLVGDLVLASEQGEPYVAAPVAPSPSVPQAVYCGFCGARSARGAPCASCGATVE